jgi:hypothetical protein
MSSVERLRAEIRQAREESGLERLQAEIRQAREEANQNAGWIGFLLIIIACGGFAAVGAAVSGLILPALVIGAAVLALWVLYVLVRGLAPAPVVFVRGVARAAASWKNQTPANLRDRLFAIGLILIVTGLPIIGVLLRRT